MRGTLFILAGIILLGIFARFYRINDLAVFLADQASDSTVMLNMLHGKFTLLGPITSVGGFYNGPIVYYLMFPFYWVLKGNMIAGTVFQSTLSVATIPLLFMLGKKMFNEKVGLVAAFLFAISPLMVDYSRAAFNSYPAVFFSTLILYLFFSLYEKFTLFKTVLLGIFLGFIFQMHYLTIALIIFVVTYPLLTKKRWRLRYYGGLLWGFTIGLSPFLFFELRHGFLNTHFFLRYILSAKESIRALHYIFTIWPDVTGKLLFGYNNILGLTGLFLIGGMSFYRYRKNKKIHKALQACAYLFVVTFAVGLLYGGIMQNHYVIVFFAPLILLCALAICTLSKNALIVGVCGVLLLLNMTAWNIEKPLHPLQQGLAIADFTNTADIIHKDTKARFNVAMHTQGDNRAMPLRYALNLLSETPVTYENYRDIDTLYFVLPQNESVESQTMWEYTSFGPSIVEKKWKVNEKYYLSRLGRVNE